jgi:SAM-dependent methyltransferase
LKMSDQPTDDERSPQNRLVRVPPAFWYFTAAHEARIRSYYELLEREFSKDFHRELVGRKTQYLNYGYWAPGCTDYDEACEALAEMLGETAGITTGDRVLDVGFGYAEQDFHWLRTRKPAQIVGINVTQGQVRVARRRAEEMNLGDRLDLRVGSATSLSFEDTSFDRVVALESSVHFDTRQEEPGRALRRVVPKESHPSGQLALARRLCRAARTGRIRECRRPGCERQGIRTEHRVHAQALHRRSTRPAFQIIREPEKHKMVPPDH